MKENKELMREVLKDVRRDMSDEEIVELLIGSHSVMPSTIPRKMIFSQSRKAIT